MVVGIVAQKDRRRQQAGDSFRQKLATISDTIDASIGQGEGDAYLRGSTISGGILLVTEFLTSSLTAIRDVRYTG